jgi:hypothetical protein
MIKRILAIAVIFLATTAAWCILGSTIFLRTESTTSLLSGRVASTWGDTQEQAQPDIHYFIEHSTDFRRGRMSRSVSFSSGEFADGAVDADD